MNKDIDVNPGKGLLSRFILPRMQKFDAMVGKMPLNRVLSLGFSVSVAATIIICLTVIWFNWLIKSSQSESRTVQSQALNAIMHSRELENWVATLGRTRSEINRSLSLLYQKQLRNEKDVTVFQKGSDPVADLLTSSFLRKPETISLKTERIAGQLSRTHQDSLQLQQKISEKWRQSHTGLVEKLHEIRRSMIYWTLKVANMLFVQSSIDELLYESPEETPVMEFQETPLFKQYSGVMPTLIESMQKIKPLNQKLWSAANDLDMHIMLSEWDKARKLYRDVFPPSIKSIGVYLDDVIRREEEILSAQKEAHQILNSELVPVLQKEIRLIDDLTVELEQLLKKQQLLVSQQTGKIESSWRQIETIIKRIQWVIILLTVISTLFSIAFINWITHRIIQPIKHLATRTEAISNGDLRHSEESVDRSDEIGMLISSISVMSNSLQGLVSQFSVTMDDVAGNAEKISVASRETAQGMNRQTSFIDDIRQKVDLISTSAAEVENSVAEVTEQSIRAENTARESFDAVNEALERMGSIKVIFSETSEGIQQLNQAVEQITQVTNMIQEIAQKSQILAINAAIEAARAGEHGKGFMVITEEIKQMSEKTIEATSRVKSNITEIETKTRIAVELSEKGMSTVTDSAEISESAQDSFSSITESTNKVAESVRRTTEIAKQQAEQTQLVVNLIEEISDISQQSNHCAEETVHIGSELNHKSNDIQTMLGQFRLN